MNKIAIVIGHNEEAKGAYSELLGYSEYDFYKEVVDYTMHLYKDLFQLTDEQIKEIKERFVIFRNPGGSYSGEMSGVVEAINKGGFDMAIELHFNAANGTAEGCTVLHWHKSENGIKLAKLFQKITSEFLGLKSRDLIPITSLNQNGAYGIIKSNVPYILVEPFFGDNVSDVNKVDYEMIALVLFKFFNIINNVEVIVKPEEGDTDEKIDEILDGLKAIGIKVASLKSSK